MMTRQIFFGENLFALHLHNRLGCKHGMLGLLNAHVFVCARLRESVDCSTRQRHTCEFEMKDEGTSPERSAG